MAYKHGPQQPIDDCQGRIGQREQPEEHGERQRDDQRARQIFHRMRQLLRDRDAQKP
ncbi:MAG: hypothetical protein JKP97_18080 [Rhodobacteraceae bacterium]|nr:hypothetical protein [Paracoccaceae bacterium]